MNVKGQLSLFESEKLSNYNLLPFNSLVFNGYWYLYVLYLTNDYYYIGITLYPSRRINEHKVGKGANFTKRNPPLKMIECYCLNNSDRKLCYKLETAKTREYRLKYGDNKVVGGKHLFLGKASVAKIC